MGYKLYDFFQPLRGQGEEQQFDPNYGPQLDEQIRLICDILYNQVVPQITPGSPYYEGGRREIRLPSFNMDNASVPIIGSGCALAPIDAQNGASVILGNLTAPAFTTNSFDNEGNFLQQNAAANVTATNVYSGGATGVNGRASLVYGPYMSWFIKTPPADFFTDTKLFWGLTLSGNGTAIAYLDGSAIQNTQERTLCLGFYFDGSFLNIGYYNELPAGSDIDSFAKNHPVGGLVPDTCYQLQMRLFKVSQFAYNIVYRIRSIAVASGGYLYGKETHDSGELQLPIPTLYERNPSTFALHNLMITSQIKAGAVVGTHLWKFKSVYWELYMPGYGVEASFDVPLLP